MPPRPLAPLHGGGTQIPSNPMSFSRGASLARYVYHPPVPSSRVWYRWLTQSHQNAWRTTLPFHGLASAGGADSPTAAAARSRVTLIAEPPATSLFSP